MQMSGVQSTIALSRRAKQLEILSFSFQPKVLAKKHAPYRPSRDLFDHSD